VKIVESPNISILESPVPIPANTLFRKAKILVGEELK
jgi:hypothetical protein